MVGLLDVSDLRDPRLTNPEIRTTIEQALQDVIDRPAHTDRETQFEEFGLKPPKKFSRASQPALDTARIESFRERLEILQHQRWEIKRGMSITISHWIIQDLGKFKGFLAMVKEKIDFLIGLMDVGSKVDTALRYDIKALGWHPVFDRMRASYDMAKLRIIQEACKDDYPTYVEAAQVALEYLNKEYKDNYQEIREGTPTSTEIPGAAAYMIAQSRQLASAYGKKPKNEKTPSNTPIFLKMFRPKSWRKGSKDLSVDDGDAKGRSMSHTPTTSTNPLTPPLTPERSKSIAAPMTSVPDAARQERKSEDNAMARTATVESAIGTTAAPIVSMISRYDYWKSPWERV
jgi:hypothetical protein